MDKQTRQTFEELLKKRGAVVVGYGHKETDGKKTRKRAIIVGVKEKLPLDKLSPGDVIPREVWGVATDVQQRDEIFFQLPKATPKGVENVGWQRPASPGCSIGHKDITAGTFGLVVRKGGIDYILSNNHVLANVNKGKIGDAILQPGQYDGGIIGQDTIASLSDYIKIEMLGVSNCPISNGLAKIFNALAYLFDKNSRMVVTRSITNKVDCAIAQPHSSSDILPFICDIGKPMGLTVPDVGMTVQKSGRTTGYTKGQITLIDAMANVNMGNNEIAIFEDQFEVTTKDGQFSAGGDSGSAILDLDKNVVGLLFAGSTTKTYCNDINNIFQVLKLELA